MNYEWLNAFLITQLIEAPLYFFVFSKSNMGPHMTSLKSFTLAFTASLLTHPIVWFVIPRFFDMAHDYAHFFVCAELFAVLTEAIFINICGVRRALLISLGINALSAGFGLVKILL